MSMSSFPIIYRDEGAIPMPSEATTLRERVGELEAELAELRAACEPFATARILPGAPENGYLIGWLDEHDGMLTVGDVRKLAALLAPDPGAPTDDRPPGPDAEGQPT